MKIGLESSNYESNDCVCYEESKKQKMIWVEKEDLKRLKSEQPYLK